MTLVPEGAAVTVHWISDLLEIDTDKVIFIFADADNSGYGRAQIGTLAGSTITLGAAITFHSVALNAGTANAKVCSFMENGVVCIVSGNATAATGQAMPVTVSGSTLTLGTPVSIANQANNFYMVTLTRPNPFCSHFY